jgi:hypothetical protein
MVIKTLICLLSEIILKAIHQFKGVSRRYPIQPFKDFFVLCLRNEIPLEVAARQLYYQGYYPLDEAGNSF